MVPRYHPAMASDSVTEQSRAPHVLAFAWLALFVVLVVGAVAITFLGNPRAGQSVVVMDVPQAHPATILATPKPAQSNTAALPQTQPGIVVPTPSPLAPPQKITTPQYAGRALIADPALIENTPEGPLPRIADDGTHADARLCAAGAQRRPPAHRHRHHRARHQRQGHRSARSTACRRGVTLAFAPYAADVQHWVGEARARGPRGARSKCRWSLTISPTAIPVRTRCAPAPARMPTPSGWSGR